MSTPPLDGNLEVGFKPDSHQAGVKDNNGDSGLGSSATYGAITSSTTNLTEVCYNSSENCIAQREEEEDAARGFCSAFKDNKGTVLTFCLSNFFIGAFYALLAPFFTNEAAKKGVTPTVVGLIFGAYELVIVIMSPIFGNYLTKLGSKFMFVTGIMICGYCCVLFGFLDESPNGIVYISLCLLVRCVEAIGAAGAMTASFAIIAYTFPTNVATMFGSLELFSGLGLMIGPPLGGALYGLGGFKLPFITMGVLLIIIGFISIILLPAQKDAQLPYKGSILSLMKIPIIWIMCLFLLAGAGAIGFLDITLGPLLQDTYKQTPMIIAVIFLVGPGVYAFTAPIWGAVADKWPEICKPMLLLGFLVGSASFLLMGPAPFLDIPGSLWLLVVSTGLLDLGIANLNLTFNIILEAAIAFIYPIAGGYLKETLDFPYASVVIGGTLLFSVVVLAVYMLIDMCCYSHGSKRGPPSAEKEDDVLERQPLIQQT